MSSRILNFNVKVMLACQTPDVIRYPVFASAKLDGIRATIVNGVVKSRTMKAIPNNHIQDLFGHDSLNGIDGELIVGDPGAPDVFHKTSSGVMSIEGEPDVTFWIFDYIPQVAGTDVMEPFTKRNARLKEFKYDFCKEWMPEESARRIRYLEHYIFKNEEDLLEYEATALGYGFEGLILRNPSAIYKQGRSTKNEQGMIKLKRFVDGEAEIVGYEEQMHNANEAFTDEIGHTKRSSHQANMVPMGVLGAFKVKDLVTGVEFDVGTGYTAKQRKEFWETRTQSLGKYIKYKHFPYGAKDKPRIPVFLGFRNPIDMG